MMHKVLCVRCKRDIERSKARDNAVCMQCKLTRFRFYAKMKRKLRNGKITNSEYKNAMQIFDKNQIL